MKSLCSRTTKKWLLWVNYTRYRHEDLLTWNRVTCARTSHSSWPLTGRHAILSIFFTTTLALSSFPSTNNDDLIWLLVHTVHVQNKLSLSCYLCTVHTHTDAAYVYLHTYVLYISAYMYIRTYMIDFKLPCNYNIEGPEIPEEIDTHVCVSPKKTGNGKIDSWELRSRTRIHEHATVPCHKCAHPNYSLFGLLGLQAVLATYSMYSLAVLPRM